MKTLLSCDQVFETLTRGPFPGGGPDDDAVELHLAACHECRCLAEALRPAATLFHESLSAVEQEQLPAYDGLLARLSQEIRTESQRESSGERQVATASDATQRLFGFGSAFLLGISLSLLVLLMADGWRFPGLAANTKRQLPVASAVYRPNPTELIRLAGEKLPSVCLPSDVSPESLSAAALACCSECHSPKSTKRQDCGASWNHACARCHQSSQMAAPGPRLVAVLRKSCVACHDS